MNSATVIDTVHQLGVPFAKNTAVLNGERNGIVGDFRGSEWAGAGAPTLLGWVLQ